MNELVPWTRPRGAVHDLSHLFSLSEDRCTILCISPQMLYVLQNWLALDVEFESRYAKTVQYNGYEPLTKDDALWSQWLTFVRAFQIAGTDMSCDLGAGLQSIADALIVLAQKQSGGGGGCGTGVAGLQSCVSGLTNDEVLGPPEATLGPEPPEGFATWEEYESHKCKAAYFIVDFLTGATYSIQGLAGAALTADVVAPLAAGLAGALPAVFTPVGFVAFIAAMVSIGLISLVALTIVIPQIRQWIVDHRDALACSLYQSGSSSAAIDAIANVIEDAIQSVSWGAILGPFAGELAPLFGDVFGALLGNGLVAPLFSTVVDLSSFAADCSSCSPAESDCGQVDRTFGLGRGTGSLHGSGIREIGLSAVGDHYEAVLDFVPDACLQLISQTGLTKYDAVAIWRWLKCVGTEFQTINQSDELDQDWTCTGRLEVTSATEGTFEIDIQLQPCTDDVQCP